MINRELINKSIDYIIEHFDEDLSIQDVADQFHFSKYYFCRSFKEVTGESVYEFIKRLKMDQSAIDIKLERSRSITDIGLDYGYSSSNYSSAFKKHHNLSPAQFRKFANVTAMQNPFYSEGLSEFDTAEAYGSRIKIIELGDFTVIYERMIGSYYELKNIWFEFLEQFKNYINDDTLMIERFYYDPAISDLNSCICDICITANEDEICGLGDTTTIKGGKYAVYRYSGEIRNIFQTIQGLFSVWLPASSLEMDKRYGLNIYREMDKENQYVTMDICIPVK